jgi:hypothetical protein
MPQPGSQRDPDQPSISTPTACGMPTPGPACTTLILNLLGRSDLLAPNFAEPTKPCTTMSNRVL